MPPLIKPEMLPPIKRDCAPNRTYAFHVYTDISVDIPLNVKLQCGQYVFELPARPFYYL